MLYQPMPIRKRLSTRDQPGLSYIVAGRSNRRVAPMPGQFPNKPKRRRGQQSQQKCESCRAASPDPEISYGTPHATSNDQELISSLLPALYDTYRLRSPHKRNGNDRVTLGSRSRAERSACEMQHRSFPSVNPCDRPMAPTTTHVDLLSMRPPERMGRVFLTQSIVNPCDVMPSSRSI